MVKIQVDLTDEVHEYLVQSAGEQGTSPEVLVSSIINCSIIEHIGELLLKEMKGPVSTKVETLRALVELGKRVKEERASDLNRTPLAGWRSVEDRGAVIELNAVTQDGLRVTRIMSGAHDYNLWIAERWTQAGDMTVTEIPDTDLGRRGFAEGFGYPKGFKEALWSL